MTAATPKTIEQLKQEIQDLGPWHQSIPVTESFETGHAFSDSGELSRKENQNIQLLSSLNSSFLDSMKHVYPEGLRGKRFLDCACNAGVYCFAARQLGAEFSFGFDVREHWINQANWVKNNRTVSRTDRIKFSVCDLYDLPKRNLPMFDVTMFKGIFYHLPDPVMALKIVSDLTREVLIFNTQAGWNEPDGYLRPGTEDIRSLMSGAYGLNWRPTGPRTMIPILSWLGYKQARLIFYRQNPNHANIGRLEIIASKIPGKLDSFTNYTELLDA